MAEWKGLMRGEMLASKLVDLLENYWVGYLASELAKRTVNCQVVLRVDEMVENSVVLMVASLGLWMA